jgi:peptidyl-tRNA hydrolase, PTH1 family
MKLIVGLGNPGHEYEKTRHNVGFQVIEKLARRWGVDLSKKKFESLVGESQVGSEKVLVALPQTYMNLSGRSVAPLLGYFKLPLTDLAVVHDEMDLPLGRLKVVRQGQPAGNRGVASIQEHLGSQDFCRFRIGIGKPEKRDHTVEYVLSAFDPSEEKILEPVLKKVEEGLEIWVEKGIEAAIQFCHKP